MNTKLSVDQTHEIQKSFTLADLIKFSEITGDRNPIHLDPEYASKTIFKKNIVHGLLLGGTISGMVASDLPGEGTIYLTQNLTFKAPVFVDERVTFKVTITNVREEKGIVSLKTQVFKADGTICVEGDAVVKVP